MNNRFFFKLERGYFAFRVYGYGLRVLNRRIHAPVFSCMSIWRKCFHIWNYCFLWLKPPHPQEQMYAFKTQPIPDNPLKGLLGGHIGAGAGKAAAGVEQSTEVLGGRPLGKKGK